MGALYAGMYAARSGNIIVAGRKDPKSVYDPKIATMEDDTFG